IENIILGSGNDTFVFESGATFLGTLNGGGGTNELDYSAYEAAVTVDLTAGTATASEVITSITNIRVIAGGSGDDILTGDSGVNRLEGGPGSDVLRGGAAIDTLIGGSGDDVYIMEGGNDTIREAPNGGFDTLDYSRSTGAISVSLAGFRNVENVLGGPGADTLTGTPANDTFYFVNGWGHDTVTDPGGSDTLDFSAVTQPMHFDFTGGAVTVTQGANRVSGAGGTRVEILVGGSSDDTFVFHDGWGNYTIASAGTIDEDVLDFSAVTVNLTFTLHDDGTVEVTDGTNTLGASAGIENIIGGSATNTFVFEDQGGLDGYIEGAGINILDYSAYTTAVYLDLGTMDVVYSGNVNGAPETSVGVGYATRVKGVNHISRFIGGASTGDVLIGPEKNNTWTIDGANSGTLNTSFTFSGIENITGSADDDDSFTVTATGSLSGTLSGNPYGLVSGAIHLEIPMNPEGVAEGMDTLILSGGNYTSSTLTATSTDTGIVDRDGNRLRFAGLESVEDGSAAVDRIFTYAADATAKVTFGGTVAKDLVWTIDVDQVTYTCTTGENDRLEDVVVNLGGQIATGGYLTTVQGDSILITKPGGGAPDVVQGIPVLGSSPLVLGSATVEAPTTKDVALRVGKTSELRITAENGDFIPFTFAQPSGHVYVNAGMGSDTITVEPFSMSAALVIDGKGGTADSIVYEVQAGDNSQSISFGTGSTSINGSTAFTYSHVEKAKNLVIRGTDGDDQIQLSEAAPGYILSSTNGTFAAVTMNAAIDSLAIDAGLGDDAVSTAGLDSFTPALVLTGGEGVDNLDLGSGHYATLTLGTGSSEEGSAGNDAVTGDFTVGSFTFNARPSIANRVHVFQDYSGKITIVDETDVGTTITSISAPTESFTINTGYNAPGTTEYIHVGQDPTGAVRPWQAPLNADLIINAGKLSKNLDGDDSVIIYSNLTLTGHRLDITANNISINSGVTVSTADSSGHGGDIDLNAFHVSLGTGGQLLADGTPGDPSTSGDITIIAMDENALVTPLVDVDVSDVDVTIAAGAVISGRDVTILASADNRRLYADDGTLQKDDPTTGDACNMLGNVFESLTQIAGAISVVKGDASIDIAAGSQVSARDFKADASVYADVKAVPSWSLAIAPSIGVAVTNAAVNVAGTIIATGNAEFRTHTDHTMNVVADPSALKGLAAAVAVSVIVSDANTVISDTAVLDVGGDLYVTADDVDRNRTMARSVAGKDGKLALSVAVSVEDGDTNALLDGEAHVAGNITVMADQLGIDVPVGKLFGLIPSQAIGTSASAGVGSPSKGDFLDDAEAATTSSLVALIGSLSGFVSKAQAALAGKAGSAPADLDSKFDLAGGVAVLVDANRTTARIGDGGADGDALNGHVDAGGSIDVLSTASTAPYVSANASASNNSDTKSEQNTSVVSGALAISVGVLKNDADAYINENAVVDVAGTLTVQAQALSDVGWSWGKNLVDALREKATYTTADETPVVDISPGDTVEFRANRTSGGDVGTWYEYAGSTVFHNVDLTTEDFTNEERWEAVNPAARKARNFVTLLSNYLIGDFGVGYFILNDGSQATASGDKLAIAGAVDLMMLSDAADARIKSGALINQESHTSTDQNVVVQAVSHGMATHFGGNISFPSVGSESGSFKDFGKAVESSILTDKGWHSKFGMNSKTDKGAVGFTITGFIDKDTALATIEDGVRLHADSLWVDAETQVLSTGVQASGGDAGNVAFNGVVAFNVIVNKTIAHIANGAVIDIGAGSVFDDPEMDPSENGSLIVSAHDTSDVISLDGAVATSQSVGIGASVGVTVLDRNTQALIGDLVDADPTAATGSITSRGNVHIIAENGGFVANLAVAGAKASSNPAKSNPDAGTSSNPGQGQTQGSGSDGTKQSNADTSGWINKLGGFLKKAGQKIKADWKGPAEDSAGQTSQSSKSGVGISGSVAVNVVNDDTRAYILNSGPVIVGDNSNGIVDGLFLDAVNSTTVGALAGAGAYAKGSEGKTSVGIAGGFAINAQFGKTEAFVDGAASLDAEALEIDALRSGWTVSLAAGLAAAAGQKSYAVGGSVGVNVITCDTTAALRNIDGSVDVAGHVALNALDDTNIIAIGGSAGFGGKVGVGVAIGFSYVENKTTSIISGLDDFTHQGGLDVLATSDGLIVTVTGSAGVATGSGGSGGKAGAGTVSVNIASNTTEAMISATTVNTGSTGDVILSAVDNTSIYSFAGALAAGKEMGLGGAVAVNVLDNTTRAAAEESTIDTTGAFYATTSEEGTVVTLAVAGAGSEKLAIAGSVALNVFQNTVDSHITNSTITAGRDFYLGAEDREISGALAGGVAISTGQSAGGAAIGVNAIFDTVTARIESSTVSASAAAVEATAEQVLVSFNVGGAGGEKFALGGSVSVNQVMNTIAAEVVAGTIGVDAQGQDIIRQSDVDATRDITVRASDDTTAVVVAGGFAMSLSSSAVGLAASTIYIENDVHARIDDSSVTSSAGKVTVSAGIAPPDTQADPADIAFGTSGIILPATNSSSIINVTFGGAGSTGNFAGGFGVSVNIINNTIDARIAGGATVDAAGDITVSAIDSSDIGAVAVGGAGAASGAAGGAASANVITNSITAGIDASTVSSAADVRVNAQSAAIIRALAVGASGAGTVAVGVSALGNAVANDVSATIQGSTVSAGGDVVVSAIDQAPSVLPDWMLSDEKEAELDQALEGTPIDLNANILAINVSVAGSGSVAVSAALSGNVITNSIVANIADSTVTAGVDSQGGVTNAEGDVYVTSVSDAGIIAVNVGVGASGAVAVQASGFGNVITNTIAAAIDDNSTVAAGGVVHVSAVNSSAINSVALSVAASGSVAVSAIIGANVIRDTISAGIADSTVTCGSALAVEAETRSTVYAFATGVGVSDVVAVQALIAANVIADSTSATITNSTVDAGGAVSLKARNVSTIDAIVIGVAASGTAAIEIPIVVNDISNTTEATITDSTLTTDSNLTLDAESCNVIRAISVGISGSGALAVTVAGLGNVITNTLTSLITGSTITAAGDVGLSANDVAPSDIPEWTLLPGQKQQVDDAVGDAPFDLSSNILALTACVAGSGAVAVSGVVSGNVIANAIRAEIVGSEIVAGGSVALDASTDSGIVSLSIGVGGSGVFAISATGFGNVISNTVAATIEGGSVVEAGGSVDLAASDDSSISSASLSIAFSGTVAISAIIGANVIADTVTAAISGSTVTAGTTLDIEARTGSAIFSAAGGAAFSTVAAVTTLAANVVTNDTEALIESSTVNAGDVALHALDATAIQSAAGQVAIGVGGGVGSGAAYNVIANTVKARVLDGSVSASSGSVSVRANGSGMIQAFAASGAGGIGAGVAGTIAIQTIGNTIEALVDRSTVSASDTVLVLGAWDGDITADGGAMSAGGVVGIGGTIVLNTLANEVAARVNNSTLTADGTGTGVTTPRWSRATNLAGWQDDRLTQTSETFHGVAVVADSKETVHSAFGTASAGLVGVAVNKAVNLVVDATEASIANSDVTEGLGGTAGIAVRAHQTTDVTDLGGVFGGSGMGGVGGFDTTIINTTTRAFIASTDNDDNTVQAGSAGVDVSAWSQELVSSETGSAAANAIGAAGAVSAVEIVADTQAYVQQVQLTTSGSLTVDATRIVDAGTKAGALNVSLLAGVGGSVDFVTIAGTTEAYLSGTTAEVAGDTSITATSHALIDGQSGTAGAGGIASVVGAASIHLIETVTRAYLNGADSACTLNRNTSPGQDVTIRAIDHAEIHSSAGALAASLLAGVGGSIDVNVIRNSAEAEIGDGVWVQAGGNVTVDAQATQQVFSHAKGFAIGLLTGIGGSVSAIGLGGGLGDEAHAKADKASGTINGLLSLSGGIDGLMGEEVSQKVEGVLSQHSLTIDEAIATDPETLGSVRAALGAQAHVTAGGDITISATGTQGATSECGQYTGGIVAVGGSLATLDLAAPVSAVVGDNANLTAGGNVTIQSESRPALTMDVKTGDYSAIVGVGAARVAVDLDLSTKATVGDSARIDAGAGLEISALTILDGVSAVAKGAVGGMLAEGEVEVSGQAALATLATVGLQAQVETGGDAAVRARSEVTNLDVEATGGAGGLAGAGGAWAEFRFTTMDTEVLLSGWSSLVAGGDVQLSATSLVDLSAYVSQDVGAVAAGAGVQAEVGTLMLTTVTVDDGANVAGQTVDITASADEIRGHATSDCDVNGLTADVVSTTRVWYVVTNMVWIDWKATVAGRDAVNVFARAGNLDAVTSSTIDCGGFDPQVTVKAYDHVDVNTLVHLTGGARLKTSMLLIASDPIFGTNTYNQDAGAIHASGLLSNVNFDAPPDWTHDSRIEFYGDAVCVPILSLQVDENGTIDTAGIVAHKDEANHEIVVDSFLYAGGVQPTAHLAAVGGSVVGTGRFLSGTAGDCQIVNQSDYALRLGSIFASAALGPVNWFVVAIDDISNFHYTNGASDSSGAVRLQVDSVGDVRLDGAISLPHGIVDIRTAGDVEDVLDAGSMMIEAWYTYLTAAGNIGSETKRIHVASRDHSFFLLEATAGQDAWLAVSGQFSDPSTPGALLYLGDLSAGGDLNLDYFGASRQTDSGWEAIDTTLQMSGLAQAGGDFNLTQWGGGLLQVYQPITAGGNVTLVDSGAIYLHQRITAGLTATVHATDGMEGSSYQRITAHDIDLAGRAVGGVGDAALKIDLAGGALTVVAEVDIGIRGVGGSVNVASMMCGAGGARLEVADTGRDDDDIIFGAGATMNVASLATLTAGDHLRLDSTARIRAGEVFINLDNAAVDPDPGRGVQWTFDWPNFQPQASYASTQRITVNTGGDDDLLEVASIGPDQAVYVHTGARDDTLVLGDGGSIVDVWGAVAYDGGAGQDLLLLDARADAVGHHFDLSQLTSDALGHWGPAVIHHNTQYGAWYENVETLDLRLGSSGDIVGIDATGDDVQQVRIDGGAGSDQFEVGSAAGFLLSDIHGQLQFTGGIAAGDWDKLSIVENNFAPGISYPDEQLTPDLFVGEGLAGLHYAEFEFLTLKLGWWDKGLTITGLTIPAGVDLGAGDNRLTVGTPDVPFATAFARGLGVDCGDGNNVVELYDTAGTADSTWGLEDTAITYALASEQSLVAEVTGTLDSVAIHLGQAGSGVSSTVTGTADVTILGGSGSDWLLAREVPTGHIVFHGAGGTDYVVIDDRNRTEARVLSLDGPPLTVPGVLSIDARIGAPNYTNGIIYDAERVEVAGGSGADSFHVNATAAATERLKLDTGAGEDLILIGAHGLLSPIHGQLDVRQTAAEDIVRVYSDSTAGTMLTGLITGTSLTGLGLEQAILWDRLGQLDLFLGEADDNLLISSLPELADSRVQINLGGGDDTLTLGSAGIGGRADLSPLAGVELAMTAGAGNDALVLDDHQSTVIRDAVLITNLDVQNLGLAQVSTLDFESLQVRLNDLGNDVTVWNLARPVTIESGSGEDTFNITGMTSDGRLLIQAGGGDDTLHVGNDGSSAQGVQGTVTFSGGAGNDAAHVYGLAPDGTVWFQGDAGDDTLHNDQFFTYAGGASGYTTQFVDGAVLFFGGEGTDGVRVKQSLVQENANTVTFDRTVAPGYGLAMGYIGGLEMQRGVWYDAEDLNVQLEAASDSANQVYINATGEGLNTLTVQGGSHEDRFHVGEAAGSSLSLIYGSLVLDGGGGYEDRLNIDDADNTTGWSNITLTSMGFSGMGLSGTLAFSNIAYVTVTPGQGADEIWFESVPYMDMPDGYGRETSYASINNLSTEDIVSMTPEVAPQDGTWRLNDAYPVFSGVGVQCHSFSAAAGSPIENDIYFYNHSSKLMENLDVWASSGELNFMEEPREGFVFKYRWTSTTNQSQDIVIYARDSEGLVTAGRFHVEVEPYATLQDQTAAEGQVDLSGTFFAPGWIAGITYSAQWQILDSSHSMVAEVPGIVTRNAATFSGTVSGAVALPVGQYELRLNVAGSDGVSLTQTASLTVTNTPPQVDAGSDAQLVGLTATLEGTAQDAGVGLGETLSYSWLVTNDATGETSATGTDPSLTLTVPQYGSYTAVLTVTDEHGGIGSDSVRLFFAESAHDFPPMVQAGADVAVYWDETMATTQGDIALSGTFDDPSGSPGETYTYKWDLYLKIPGSDDVIFLMTLGTQLNTTFSYTAEGNWIAALTVTDSEGHSGTDSLTIRVSAIPYVATTYPIVAYEGENISGASGSLLATFQPRTPIREDFIDGFTGTIGWGDGTSTAAALTLQSKVLSYEVGGVGYYRVAYQVRGADLHAYTENSYAEPGGVYRINIDITNSSPVVDPLTIATTARVDAHVPVILDSTVLPDAAVVGQPTTLSVKFEDGPEWTYDRALHVFWGDGLEEYHYMTNDQRAVDVQHSYAAAGDYTVRITVERKDQSGSAGGSSAVATRFVTVTPQTQVAIQGLPTTSPEGSEITLGASVSDPGNLVLAYAWTVTKDGVPYGAGNAESFAFTPDDDADYNVILVVSASDGRTRFAAGTVTVTNVAPTIALTEIASEVDEGSSFTLDFSATGDPGADTVTGWTIDWGDGTAVENLAADATRAAHVYAAGPALHTITAVATDEDGNNTATIDVMVKNVAPTVSINGLPETSPEGTAINLSATVSDAGVDDVLSYAWSLLKDGLPIAVGSAANFTFTPDDDAVYEVNLSVSDGDGGVGQAAGILTVSNVAPTLTISGAATVLEDELYALNLSTSDPGDDTVSAWVINWGDGTTAQGVAGNATTVTHVYAEPGEYTITAQATDEDGTYDSNPIAVSVSSLPDVTIVGLPAESPEGTAINLSPNVTDPGTGGITLSWSVTKDGDAYGAGAGETFSFTPDDNAAYQVTLLVTDNSGATGRASGTVMVTDVAPNITLTGNPPEVDEGSSFTLEFSATGDPGTDTITGWTVDWGDGTAVENLAADATGATHVYAGGPALYTITAAAIDEDGPHTATTGVTVKNVAPTVTIDGLPTGLIYEGDEIALTSTVNDAGVLDILTYEWTVTKDGAPYGETGIGSDYSFTPNDNAFYVITLKVSDGSDVGQASANIEVGNVTPIITLSGAATVKAGQPYTLTLSATDDPGDDSISRWHISWGEEGAPYEIVEGNPATVVHTYSEPGVYGIIGYATDEDGDHLPDTSISVDVKPPTAGDVSIIGLPDTIPEGTLVNLTAVVSGSIATTFAYEWLVASDDIGGYGLFGGTERLTFIPEGEGSYHVFLTVTDADGNQVGSTSQSFTVTDVAPTLTLYGAASATAGAPYLLYFTASGNGIDEIMDWAIDWGDGAWDYVGPSVGVAVHTYTGDPAECTISAQAECKNFLVYDAGNTITVDVSAVAPPVSIGGLPAISPEGKTIHLTAGVRDAAADAAFYSWTATKDGAEFATGDNQDFTFTPDDNAIYDVALFVADTGGAEIGQATGRVTVSNVAPDLHVSGSAVALSGTPYTLDFSATDPGADSIGSWTVCWGDGTIEILPGTRTSATHTYAGNWYGVTAFVFATDEDGTFQSPTPLSIRVEAADAPLRISGLPAVSPEGTEISVTAVVSESLGQISAYSWEVTKDGSWYAGGDQESLAFTPDDNGLYEVYLSVSDQSASYDVFASFTVTDVAPTLLLDGAEGFTVGWPYLLSYSVSDPGDDRFMYWFINWGDGTLETIEIEWTDDGGTAPFHPTPTTAVHSYADDLKQYVISSIAIDEDGTYDAVNTITVTAIGPVSINGFSGTSSPEGASIALDAAVNVPTVGTPVYAWTVTKNGSVYATGAEAGLTFTPDDDGAYEAGLVVTDDNGTVGTAQKSIAVINVAPVAVDDAYALAEDTSLTLPPPALLANDSDVGDDELTVVSVGDATHGSVVLDASGNVVFSSDHDFSGTAGFQYTISDGDGDTATATVNLIITPVNDAPAGTSTAVTTLEDTAYVFTATDFGFTDPNDSPADNFLAVEITSLPNAGSLTYNGAAAIAGQSISLADLAAGRLLFTPAADVYGSSYAWFSFRVQDDGGTADGGVDLDPVAKTMTVNV
ncbi:MAG: cadherin-like domain-containing protein, partial [Rhodopirellula sp.]|nr:cadherin-like domain-containing protein [Rhodopirellula sp.]